MAPKRRRLSDLYVVGKEVPINDDAGLEPIVVWVQKLNPVENETALRAASAARARYLACRKKPDSEEYRSAMGDIMDFTNRDSLVEVCSRDEIFSRRVSVEAEVSAEEEWSKDDYLQGLFDSWDGTQGEPGLKLRYAEDPEDPEARQVFAEIQRYNAQVEKIVEGERESIQRDYAEWPDEKLLDMAVSKMIENRSLTLFLKEHETQQLFFAVRDPSNHRVRYFEDRDEVLSLDDHVRGLLMEQLHSLMVERDEGKDSRGIPASSSSSAPSGTEGTDVSSGLVAATP